MCVNCVMSVTTFVLPVIVGGVGVLQARLRRADEAPEPSPEDAEGDCSALQAGAVQQAG